MLLTCMPVMIMLVPSNLGMTFELALQSCGRLNTAPTAGALVWGLTCRGAWHISTQQQLCSITEGQTNMTRFCCVYACAQRWQCTCYICTRGLPGLTTVPSALACMASQPPATVNIHMVDTCKLETVVTWLSSTVPACLVRCS